MVQMFQFTVLACFTLLYVLIGLVLAVRLCAPLIRSWSNEPESRQEDEGDMRNAKFEMRSEI